MWTRRPALVSAFLGGALLYLSIYLPVQPIIYAYGTLRQMTR
jgi:hypothetical protein